MTILNVFKNQFVYPESSEEQLVSLANFTEQQTWTKPLQECFNEICAFFTMILIKAGHHLQENDM